MSSVVQRRESAGLTLTRSTAGHLPCAEGNSASYPQRDGKCAVAAYLVWTTQRGCLEWQCVYSVV